jgi:hypothetical protein
MNKVVTALVAAAAVGMVSTFSADTAEARCRGCAVGAGVAAGIIGGALIGSAIANSPAYAAPAPVYAAPGPGCYYTRQRVWDDYYQVWRRGPRMLVCP